MKTELQFQLVSSMPEHERQFRRWQDKAKKEGSKNKNGSYKAFHGYENTTKQLKKFTN
jgi:hypothetical protein